MRRLQLLASIIFCIGLCTRVLTAQMIPLAPGNEWVYQDSGLRDTLSVRIVGNGPAGLLCERGSQSHAAWFDDRGYVYLPIKGGILICRSKPSDKVPSAAEPLLFLPDTVSQRRTTVLEKGCEGRYVLIGVATVETPAGTFENCLIFDDHNVHRICIKPGLGIVKEERYREGGGERSQAAGERVMTSSRVLLRYTLGEVRR